MAIDRVVRSRRGKWVYLLAAVLMVIRVDFWWWGQEMPFVLFGWLSLPMLYQFAIWLVGYILVLYTAQVLWADDD